MGGSEMTMLEVHDQEIKEQNGRLKLLESEHQTFKIQMESIKLDNAKLQTGQASLEHTVSSLSISVRHLDNTVTEDGKETRGMLKTAFQHVLDRDTATASNKFSLNFRKLEVKEKIFIGIIGILGGGGGLLAGIAGIITIMGGN